MSEEATVLDSSCPPAKPSWPVAAVQAVVHATKLCEWGDDGYPRKRNYIGAWGWAKFSAGTECECCLGIRALLLVVSIPAAFVLGLFVA
jgi:hypothetical protein